MEQDAYSTDMNIALTGPESTGKSFLATHLQKKFHAKLVPEFARDYLAQSSGSYSYEDFIKMARGQWQRLNDFQSAEDLVIFDTEMIVFQVWGSVKYKKVEPWISESVKNQPVDHYLLCCPDLPWEYDELRECPDEEERFVLFDMYEQLLRSHQLPFTVIKGSSEDRINLCETIVRELHLQNE